MTSRSLGIKEERRSRERSLSRSPRRSKASNATKEPRSRERTSSPTSRDYHQKRDDWRRRRSRSPSRIRGRDSKAAEDDERRRQCYRAAEGRAIKKEYEERARDYSDERRDRPSSSGRKDDKIKRSRRSEERNEDKGEHRRRRSHSDEHRNRRRSPGDVRSQKNTSGIEDRKERDESIVEKAIEGMKRSRSSERDHRMRSESRGRSGSGEDINEDCRKSMNRCSTTRTHRRDASRNREEHNERRPVLDLKRVVVKVELDHLKMDVEERPSSSGQEDILKEEPFEANESNDAKLSEVTKMSPTHKFQQTTPSKPDIHAQTISYLDDKCPVKKESPSTMESSTHSVPTVNVAMHAGRPVLLVPGPIAGTYVMPGAETSVQPPQPASSTTPSHHAEGYSSGVDSDEHNFDDEAGEVARPETARPENAHLNSHNITETGK